MIDAAIMRVLSALADETVPQQDREKLRKELAILRGMREDIINGGNRVQ
jgi:hypothetical protein